MAANVSTIGAAVGVIIATIITAHITNNISTSATGQGCNCGAINASQQLCPAFIRAASMKR